MEISMKYSGQVAAIHLAGRFDFSSHPRFREACHQALSHEGKEIHVELSKVDYLDSSALGMLLLLRDKCQVSAKKVILSHPSRTVLDVLNVANFFRMFEMRGVPAE